EELGMAVIVMQPLGTGALLRDPPQPEELEPLGVETWPPGLLKWALSGERGGLVIPAPPRPERGHRNTAARAPPLVPARARARLPRPAGLRVSGPRSGRSWSDSRPDEAG